MTTKTLSPSVCTPATSARLLSGLGRFSLWRSRRALERLDVEALDDVGISPSDAAKEAARPIWDVPASWRR